MKTDSDELDRHIDNARRRSAAAQLAIAEKLETVEKQIRETVAGTQSAINDVVTNVKSTISDTTNSVKRTFDLPYQTRRHPWLAFGSAVLVGYLLGGRNGKTGVSKRHASKYEADSYGNQMLEGLASGVLNQIKGEIGSLRSAAVGAIITALWKIGRHPCRRPTDSPPDTKFRRPGNMGGKIGATK